MKPQEPSSKDEWPFDLWLKTAVRNYGISPHEFWQMSVRDWLALLAGHAPLGFDRTDLNTMMKNFPDKLSESQTHD